MLSDAEILVLKLAFERQLLDDAALARCVALYKAARGGRRLGDILTQEGNISNEAAVQIGRLSKAAQRAKGSVIVSRRDMEDELLLKLLEHSQACDIESVKRAQLEQKGHERQGRFALLGEILVNRNLISQINYRKLRKRALDRLASCASCYRHYVTPQVLPQSQYPCRHCGGTIYVGEMPAEAFATAGQASPAQAPLTQAAPMRAPQRPVDSTQIRRPGDKDPNRIFMTGRFDAIPVINAKPPPPDPTKTDADQEMTVALTQLRSSKDAESAPQGAKFGDFEVIAELARGGYGVVYKARYAEELVALKVLIGGDDAPEQAIKRFKREAELCKKLRHHGIVGHIASGQIAGFDYMALEFVEGETLEAKINNGALDPKVAAKMLKEIAEAVQYAHRKGIIHRDLKPANIIVDDETQKPKVIDFGVAKSLKEEMKFTQSGATIGTPFYMSPEQVKGQHDKIGPRTDIYALGVILYEMLTGQVPFTGDNPMELYHNIASSEVVLPSTRDKRIPKDLETVCLCAMAKDLEERYESSLELAKDLGRFLSGRPVEATRPGAGLFANPTLLIGIGAAIALLIVIAVTLLKG